MRIQKSALHVISTNELAFMDMENTRLPLSLLFVVQWIYSYNLIVRGLGALLTVGQHYSVVIYITHWI